MTHPTRTVTLKDAERFVGLPYLPGEMDCADLAARVQRELFGRAIALPAHRQRPQGARGQAREIAALKGALAQRIDAPATGCGVLLYEPTGADAASAGRLWHIGTVFMQGPDVWVLHNSAALGSAHLQRLEHLQRMGLRLENYYTWN